MNIKILSLAFIFFIFINLKPKTKIPTVNKNETNRKGSATAINKKIMLLPLGKISKNTINNIEQSLKEIFPEVTVMKREQMPANSITKIKNKFQADSIINWMHRRGSGNEVYLGVTSDDICHLKGQNPTYGIMGLGFRPGNACVASDHRVRIKSNFFKIAIHELGHTAGLKHCPDKTCYMRDAEGHDPTGEEHDFCGSCKLFLKKAGWNLQ